VGANGATLTFELTVADEAGNAARDQVQIAVFNVNAPPTCHAARSSRATLWPPDHRMVPVGVTGVSDPDGDRVSVTITGVTQDEPVDGADDGHTAPDAVLEGGIVLLRAERSGRGNGRVYRVEFTASDDDGASCSGAVDVAVPHDQGRGHVPVDDGQAYDSVRP
jgi:hypothetical protein